MSPKVNELLAAALALSPTEREELADCLWASLDPVDNYAGMTEEEFIAELDRRAAELEADPTHGVLWEDVQNLR